MLSEIALWALLAPNLEELDFEFSVSVNKNLTTIEAVNTLLAPSLPLPLHRSVFLTNCLLAAFVLGLPR